MNNCTLTIFLLLLISSCSSRNYVRTPYINKNGQKQKIKSLAYTGYGIYSYSDDANERYLNDLKNLGGNSVSILFTCFTANKYGHNIDCNTFDTPRFSEIEDLIYKAKEMGLFTNIRIYIDLKDETWRCHWNPINKTLAFKNLKKTLLHYAELAEELKIDSMILGAEYCNLTGPQYNNEWKKIVREVRKKFKGKITYGANWALPSINKPEFENITFWKLFDWIGIDHYWPYSGNKNSTKKLIKFNKNILKRYEAVSKKYKMDVLITEIGFPGAKDSSRFPYKWDLPGPSNEEEQSNNYKIALETISKSKNVSGFYIWRRNAKKKITNPKTELNYELFGRKSWKTIKKFFKHY